MEECMNQSEELPLFNPELIDFINLSLETIQTTDGKHLTKIINPEEFWCSGYLQESNRRFFHPLGLALTIQVDGHSGEIKLGSILDGRHDPRGISFAPGMAVVPRMEKIDREWAVRSEARMKKLGYVLQPLA